MSNTLGKIFTFTSFGESHGRGIGGIVDGCPAGIEMDEDYVQKELNRRRPGQSDISTPRKEGDKVDFLSGIFEGKTTGTPIAFVIWNENQHSADYDHLKEVYRPSHADYTYQQKYGIRDYRGGGRRYGSGGNHPSPLPAQSISGRQPIEKSKRMRLYI